MLNGRKWNMAKFDSNVLQNWFKNWCYTCLDTCKIANPNDEHSVIVNISTIIQDLALKI